MSAQAAFYPIEASIISAQHWLANVICRLKLNTFIVDLDSRFVSTIM